MAKCVHPGGLFLVFATLASTSCVSSADPGAAACPAGTSRLAYTTAAREIRQTDVAVLNDGDVVRVTHDQLSQDPSFSPDGDRIVFSTGRGGDVDFEYGDGYERLALFTATWDGRTNNA